MPETKPKDELSPSQKDAVEGGRDRSEGAPPSEADLREEGHLGAGGDPAEGPRRGGS